MRNDSRLSRMLHALLHLARSDSPMTSEQMAEMLGTNPVVVRRTMAGMRDAGYVLSEKGHGGGWSIACDLKKVTLLDIHKAVGGPHIFAIGIETKESNCAVQKAVNSALKDALREAEDLLVKRLGCISLSDLLTDFDAHCQAIPEISKLRK
ncbi:Rrf2 family transcriptional regulator [Pectobacterium sp. B1J-3]|uniref:Rrf2 family transcriptional regulator n=1 Tax=Pectobacterium sp. B1J-3 TaxID=3385371 RepID=UPI003905CC51